MFNNDMISHTEIPYRDPIQLLKLEARKKPQIAYLLDNVMTLSDDEIENLQVMKWIKRALTDIRWNRLEQERRAKLEISMQDKIIDYNWPDPPGETRIWIGMTTYIRMGHSMVEIKDGQMLWIDSTGVWLDTIHSKVIDPQIMQNTRSCGMMPRSDYLGLERKRRNGLSAPTETVVYGQAASSTTTQTNGLFTIYKI